MAPVSMNFGPQNCGAVPRTSVDDQGAARMIEDYYDFPTGSDYCRRCFGSKRGWPGAGARPKLACWLCGMTGRRSGRRATLASEPTIQFKPAASFTAPATARQSSPPSVAPEIHTAGVKLPW